MNLHHFWQFHLIIMLIKLVFSQLIKVLGTKATVLMEGFMSDVKEVFGRG